MSNDPREGNIAVRETISQAAADVARTLLTTALQFLPLPAGEAVIGLPADVAERLIRAYSKDGGGWDHFFGREMPMHNVTVNAFQLARTPVTNLVYAQFMTHGGYTDSRFWTPEGWAWVQRTGRTQPYQWSAPNFSGSDVSGSDVSGSHFNGEDQPVVGLSWYEAMAVAQWAALTTGLAIRLPSEAEWEWAARGANPKNLYPWGAVLDVTKLNSGVPSESHPPVGHTVAVGSYSPQGDGPFGHADLLGQTWEWTNSQYVPYPYVNDLREDRYAPSERILRGGNWADGKYNNRVTARYHYSAHYSDKTTGVRLAIGDPVIKPRPPYDLVIYGKTTFCPDLENTKHWLQRWNVPYRQMSYDQDEQVALQLDSWLGSRTVPTLVIARYGGVTPITAPADADLSNLRNTDRGSMLHEPDEATLHAFLTRHGMV